MKVIAILLAHNSTADIAVVSIVLPKHTVSVVWSALVFGSCLVGFEI